MSWLTGERLFVFGCMALGVVWLIAATEIAARRSSRDHDRTISDLSSIHRHRQAAQSLDRARRCHPTHKDYTP